MKTIKTIIDGKESSWVPEKRYNELAERLADAEKTKHRFNSDSVLLGVFIGVALAFFVVLFWNIMKLEAKQEAREASSEYASAWVPFPLNRQSVERMMANYEMERSER